VAREPDEEYHREGRRQSWGSMGWKTHQEGGSMVAQLHHGGKVEADNKVSGEEHMGEEELIDGSVGLGSGRILPSNIHPPLLQSLSKLLSTRLRSRPIGHLRKLKHPV
jgi:2,4-dienoyl-CoA reductase-like NADH-dependent reductase (Old Yellow Enzyme family)